MRSYRWGTNRVASEQKVWANIDQTVALDGNSIAEFHMETDLTHDPQGATWEIRTNLGRHARAGTEGTGWLWEISRGDQLAHVIIEISGSAWSTDPLDLTEDTRQALETDGRTELLKVLDRDDPPPVIRCGPNGCVN
jgi:hypothetical protein